MSEKGFLLFEPSEHSEARKLTRLLDFFGVSVSRSTVADFLAVIASHEPPKSRLLCSASAFLEVTETLEHWADASSFWRESVQSVYVYGAGDAGSLGKLAARLWGDDRTLLVRVTPDTKWVVSDKLPAFCKSMSGVHVAARASSSEAVLHLDDSATGALKVVSCEAGAALVKLEFREVPVFLSTSDSVVDLDSSLPLPQFDIRQEFLSAAPIVMYVKWAFEGTCWQAPETSACLVIDDPPLKPRYGFLEFQHLLDLMRAHNFSTSIAFIPWNWRRSTASVVRLFKENPDRYSLSIHGCDHTGGEFGTRDIGRLAWKSKEAAERMARHASRTGIRHDPVMVFPQGIFSETAMRVLKRGGFMSVVNSEVTGAGSQQHPVKVADYWDVAVMNYGNFPIFTRRYPTQGIENFAFDSLLGKPCIIVIHHNNCHDRGQLLAEFVDRLNALNVELSWRSLGEVVRRSFREREISPGLVEVEMYGSELRVENRSSAHKRFRIGKREDEPDLIQEIRAGSTPVGWTAAEGRVLFEIELSPGESKTVRINFAELCDAGFQGESLGYRIKATVRRYLSEVRDNYLTRLPFLGSESLKRTMLADGIRQEVK